MSIRPGTDDLAARIDRVRWRRRRNVGFHRRDPAAGDRHVADRVEPERGIDDAPALDDQIVGRRKRVRNAGEQQPRLRRLCRKTGAGSSSSISFPTEATSPRIECDVASSFFVVAWPYRGSLQLFGIVLQNEIDLD